MASENKIDPEWAWEDWSPANPADWNRRTAAHLFRRAGFGASRAELTEAEFAGHKAAISTVLQKLIEPEEFISQSAALAQASLAGGDPKQLSAWWVHKLLTTPAQLLEKLTLFWHGHFATSAQKVEDAELMFEQNGLFRNNAAGSFGELTQAISQDPAMLIYLDSASNRKAHPNENYAREVMELFCLGEGQYTEGDIRELARCFTGWEVKRKKFRFNRYQHDNGTKTVLGNSGTFGGKEGVDIVLAQDATAEFICQKLVNFFVMDEPKPSSELVAPLAELFRANSLSIEPVIACIFRSNLFFSKHAIGRKVRSPVEFAVGFFRAFEASTNAVSLAESLNKIGQGLFFPPSVKGWDGGRTWINSSTLLGRSNLIRKFLTDTRTRFGRKPIDEYLREIEITNMQELVAYFDESLFATRISDDRKRPLRSIIDAPFRRSNIVECICALTTMPEFQLG